MKINKRSIKKLTLPIVLAIAFFIGFTGASVSTDAQAFTGSCGVVGNCYYVPDGCGVGKGCTNVECDDSKCPDPGTNGTGCHYCSSAGGGGTDPGVNE